MNWSNVETSAEATIKHIFEDPKDEDEETFPLDSKAWAYDDAYNIVDYCSGKNKARYWLDVSLEERPYAKSN